MHKDHIHIINKFEFMEYGNAVCKECGKDFKEILEAMQNDAD